MLKLLLRRLISSIVLIILIPGITFFIQGLIPGNAAAGILGVTATKAQIAALDRQLGLDEPIVVRYGNWLVGFLHGDLGTSLINGEPVTQILGARLAVSLSLVIGSIIVLTVIGVVAGIVASIGGRVWGPIVDTISTAGLAIPNFWFGVILVGFFAVQLAVLPATGYVTFTSDPGGWLVSLILPVAALAFAGTTVVAKQTREQMVLALASPYARSLRANGVPERSLIFRHALRNASGPVVTVIGLVFVGALSGTVVVENIFVLPGLGSEAIIAATGRDYPVVQGIAVYFTLIVVVVNVVIDIANGVLNPKVRAS
jgi:peptide/nickel transport system permease protein